MTNRAEGSGSHPCPDFPTNALEMSRHTSISAKNYDVILMTFLVMSSSIRRINSCKFEPCRLLSRRN